MKINSIVGQGMYMQIRKLLIILIRYNIKSKEM